MSMMPVVERLPLVMGALAIAVRDGAFAENGQPVRPRGDAAWRDHIAACQRPLLGNDWAHTLRDAMRASGAAAARLARVSDGQGVVVTTGQQPGLFGGPMYTIVKALSALALANRIEAQTGVPTAAIFWAATDDADFAEGAGTWLPSKGSLVDAHMRGAPSEGTMMSDAPLPAVNDAVTALRSASAGAAWPEVIRAAERAYHAGSTIGGAYVALMRHVLEPLGITVLDAAHRAVRIAGNPLLRRALEDAESLDRAVSARTGALRASGYAPQVELVENRSLVFVVHDGVKERAAVRGGFAAAEQLSSDSLSPNVLLRPVLERALLPTVAYMAGPGEMAYFAQVSAVASALGVAAPLALPRTSLRIVTPEVAATLARVGQSADAMRDTHALQRSLAQRATPDASMDALTILRTQVRRTHETLRASHAGLSPAALDGAVAQVGHRVARLERRVLAASKRTIDDDLQRVENTQRLLWPHGGPQERAVNLLPWLARYGTPLLDRMLEACDDEAVSLVND
jgi:bacillithiol synthase